MFVIYDEKKQRKPIKVWLKNIEQIEEGCLEQAYNLSNLPFIHKWVALMPDTHQGYGMPIGGIICTKEVIIPNAVGVDIGCLDNNTEFLTEKGWKKISEYTEGDKVLQYDKKSDTAYFVIPINYIVKNCDEFYHFKNNKGLDQMLCMEHKMLIWRGYKSRGYNLIDMTPVEVVELENKLDNGYYGIKTSFNICNQEGVNLSDDEIKLDIMTSADGHIRKENDKTNEFELHFSKKRKIERAMMILNACNVNYKETKGNDGTRYFYFSINKKFNKDLSKYFKANYNQLKIVAEESLLWDGYKGYRSFYSSTNKMNSDVIQFAFASINIRASITTVKYKNKNWKQSYIVTPTKNNIIGITNTVNKVKSDDGKKYCFTVPSGYFVARRDGKIFITGNCGVIFIETNLHKNDISIDQYKNIVGNIMRNIPQGFDHHKTKQQCIILDEFQKQNLKNQPQELINEIQSGYYQVGTLGSGNHFIELQEDENGKLCIMIHSGSRNFGYKVAKYYNNIAKELNQKYFSIVPQEYDLAFLPTDTIEGQNYILWMNLSLNFARENRHHMMNKMKEILFKVNNNIEFYNEINAHHNYATIENHYNKNVWVHRKGAICVREGMIGIIPGAMGSYSYIVEGLGNPESFHSCSHGAGRVMSRKKAKESIPIDKTILDLREQNVILGKQKKNDVSEESRFAYKDIDMVIGNEFDLVKPIKKLKTIAVVKG